MTICILCEIREVKDSGMLCEECRQRVDSGDPAKLHPLLTDALPLDPKQFVRMPDKQREPDLTPYQLSFINHSKGTCPYCEHGVLTVGPMAGQTNLNCRCQECREECCIFTWHGRVVHGSKIVRDEPLPESYWDKGLLKEFLK